MYKIALFLTLERDTSFALERELEIRFTIVGELIPMIIPSRTITASNSTKVKPFLSLNNFLVIATTLPTLIYLMIS